MGGIKNVLIKNKVKRVILHAGHGGKDPGAVWGKNIEREQAIWLVDRIGAILREKGVEVVIAPHHMDSHESVPWINQRYKKVSDGMCIEVHRDSAPSLANNQSEAQKRMGVYYGDTKQSKEIADQMVAVMERQGAVKNSWARSHKQSRFKYLYAVKKPNTWAWIMELGFVQGGFSNKEWLASTAAIAIYETLTGKSFVETPPKKEEPGMVTELKKELQDERNKVIKLEKNLREALDKTKELTTELQKAGFALSGRDGIIQAYKVETAQLKRDNKRLQHKIDRLERPSIWTRLRKWFRG